MKLIEWRLKVADNQFRLYIDRFNLLGYQFVSDGLQAQVSSYSSFNIIAYMEVTRRGICNCNKVFIICIFGEFS